MNLDNVIFETFKVAGQEVIVRTFLDDDIAQIIVDDKLVAEYGFGGVGYTFINEVDPRILLTLLRILHTRELSKKSLNKVTKRLGSY